MPYVAPTPNDLRAMFPDFQEVQDGAIQPWLARAGRDVDTSWAEGDYAYAIMLLAAHFMSREGIGKPAQGTGLPEGVTDFRSGSFSVSIDADVAKASVASGYGSTRYGRDFALLLAKNRGGSRTTGVAAMACNPGFNGFAGPIPVWNNIA